MVRTSPVSLPESNVLFLFPVGCVYIQTLSHTSHYMHTVVTMPGTHRLTIHHPRMAFPDSKIDKLSRLYSPRLDRIMKRHVLSSSMMTKMTTDEKPKLYTLLPYIQLLEVEDLGALSTDGFQLCQFWSRYRTDRVDIDPFDGRRHDTTQWI